MMKIKSLFIKKYNGFSLMEMMTVMLIISILAAFSAPMINRKMMLSLADKSPWLRNGAQTIYYNETGSDSVLIGSMNRNSEAEDAKLQITTSGTIPFIALNEGNNESLKFRFANTGIAINTASDNPAKHSVAIGAGAIAGEDSIAIGQGAESGISSTTTAYLPSTKFLAPSLFKNLITPAYAAYTYGADTEEQFKYNDPDGDLGGGSSSGSGSSSSSDSGITGAIAIGKGAKANYLNSVAIGKGATTSADNQIVLGDVNSTVYIKGNLVVDKNVYLGRNEDAKIYLRPEPFGDTWTGRPTAMRQLTIDNENLRGVNSKIIAIDEISLSDRRLKNVGATFEGGLDQIRKLEVFNYTFKKDKSKTPRVGVMAQDLEKIYPNAVTKGDDGFLRIRMEDMFYSMVNAIKELDKNLINRSNKLVTLEKDSKSIEKSLARIEKRIAKLERKIK